MQIAIIGLGRMGGNMVRRLLQGGHEVVVWNRDHSKSEELAKAGARPAKTIEDVAKMLGKPRAAWVMLPSGDVTEAMVNQLGALLEAGDTIIDGGNSMFKDDVRLPGDTCRRQPGAGGPRCRRAKQLRTGPGRSGKGAFESRYASDRGGPGRDERPSGQGGRIEEN